MPDSACSSPDTNARIHNLKKVDDSEKNIVAYKKMLEEEDEKRRAANPN